MLLNKLVRVYHGRKKTTNITCIYSQEKMTYSNGQERRTHQDYILIRENHPLKRSQENQGL